MNTLAPHSWGFLFVEYWVDLDKETTMKKYLPLLFIINFFHHLRLWGKQS